MNQAAPPDHRDGKPDRPKEILDLLDLLVEIALAEIMANDANNKQRKEGEIP